MSDVDRREVEALQAALAGVHAAMWGYGVLGPRSGDDEDRALREYARYRDLRQRLGDLLAARGAAPVAAGPAYRLPFRVTDPASARRLAVRLEDGCANLFADMVTAAAGDGVRGVAARALADAAERRVQWGYAPQAFPGLPERSR